MRDNHLNVSLIREDRDKINKISSQKILKDTLMFPPQDKLINLNLNKNFCLRDKKKQMGFDILRTVFISRETGPENIVICYVMRIIRALSLPPQWSLCSQEKSRKKRGKIFILGEQRLLLDLRIDINVGSLRLVNNGNVLCDCFSIYN